MKGMKYHDYIWDLGGTLLDNYETSTAAFVETLAEFGIEQEHDSVYEALKVSTAFAIEKYAPGIENFLKKYKENEARELEHPVLFDGIPTLLENISDQGGRNFLVSGLVIGDRAIDVEAGHAAGLDAYLFEDVVSLKQAIDM